MMSLNFDLEMAKEISERLILHWNYRGYSSLPEELCACGKHICELYLKYNNISELVSYIIMFFKFRSTFVLSHYFSV